MSNFFFCSAPLGILQYGDKIIDCKATFKHVETHMTTSVYVFSLKDNHSNLIVTEENHM